MSSYGSAEPKEAGDCGLEMPTKSPGHLLRSNKHLEIKEMDPRTPQETRNHTGVFIKKIMPSYCFLTGSKTELSVLALPLIFLFSLVMLRGLL